MANRQLGKMSAWLVTWEWVGDHAKREDKVAAIFNPRLSSEHVRDLVEFLYLNTYYSLSERLMYAHHPSKNPYPAKFGQTKAGVPWYGEIHCGNNPFLRARLVSDLAIERGPNGEEWPTWKERPRP